MQDIVPRIWWIGTGAANALPFHAAGEFDTRDLVSIDNCLRQSVSSYALSIESLAQARADASEGTRRILKRASVTVVTMPTTPGQSDLDGVTHEYKKIYETIGKTWTVARLNCPSVSRVLEVIPNTHILHFACHGASDNSNPLDSHLLLQKTDQSGVAVDKLTVSTLLNEQKTRATWLAYLSACSTAEVKAESLRDESIHLTSAFQMAGFAHVIGSLWAVDDETSAQIARLFYKSLQRYSLEPGVTDAVARALHFAVRTTAEQYRGHPELWAPFIHIGP